MSDYIAKFRTNYFTVTDPHELFRLASLQNHMKVIHNEENNTFMMFGSESWDEDIETNRCENCETAERPGCAMNCEKPTYIDFIDELKKSYLMVKSL